MSDETRPNIISETIAWCCEQLSDQAVAYLLNCTIPELDGLVIGACAPTERQSEIVAVLTAIRTQIPGEASREEVERMVRTHLMELHEGRPLIVHMRLHINNQAPVVPEISADPVEVSLQILALDVYPAFLLPPDREFAQFGPREPVHAARLYFRHPAGVAFREAVLGDPVLRLAFATDTEHGGRMGLVRNNAGSGGSLQLLALPGLLLNRAWRQLPIEERSPDSFANAAANELAIARRLIGGRTSKVVLRAALAGVLLPSGTRRELDCGVLRAATEADWAVAPDHIKGELQTSDASGRTVTIHYQGDVILDYNFPLKLRVQEWDPDDLRTEFPAELQYPPDVNSTLTRLRFSLALAVERESRTLLLLAWQSIDTPLDQGSGVSFSDLKATPHLSPVQLTESEFEEWMRIYDKLNTKAMKRVELAFGRILRAMSERREPADMLVDAVIAWENLFGTRDGEPTLRVTSSIAILLEDSIEGRMKLRKRLTDIYGLRSDVVHGNRNLEFSEYPQCHEALDVAIRVIKVLVTVRPEILELSDGAARSNRLILGG